MEKHQKIDRVALTICAYVFGALVARQLAPETIHASLAGEPNETAVAQADEQAAIVSQPESVAGEPSEHPPASAATVADPPHEKAELIAPANRNRIDSSVAAVWPAAGREAPVTAVIANNAASQEAPAGPQSSNRSRVTVESELRLPESVESIEDLEDIHRDVRPQVVAVKVPTGDVASNRSDESNVNTEDDTTVPDHAAVEDNVAVQDYLAAEGGEAVQPTLADEVSGVAEVNVLVKDDMAIEDEAANEFDLAIEQLDEHETAGPAMAIAEPQRGDNCPGAPLGEAEPVGVEPTGIFANKTTGGTKADAGRSADEVTGSPAPSVTPQATPELTPKLIALERKISRALDIYRHRNLNTTEHSAWSIMHSLISFGVEKELFIKGPGGQRVNAIGWICFNGLCRGENLFYLKNGRIQGRLGPGRQGHNGQFLAMLAQSRVKIDYPMRVDGREFTIADLVRAEQETCRPKSELTFKLIGLSHYLDSDVSWKSDDGQSWTIDRMVGEEIRQPIIGAACGGTHRLFGLAYAVDRRRRSGRPIDGNFRRAEIYLDDYHDYVFRLQNRDGSFSTNWFSGRGGEMDLDRRLDTTGHTTEWLSFSLPDEELLKPQMVKAVNYLADLLIDGQNREWKIGPQGHGLHALNIYHRRVFSSAAGRAIESLTDANQRRRSS